MRRLKRPCGCVRRTERPARPTSLQPVNERHGRNNSAGDLRGQRNASAGACEGCQLPCHRFAANDAWLTLVLFAQTLVCWTRRCVWMASLAWPSPSRCVTGCGIPPGGWSATAAGSSYACNVPGPGRRSWWRRSRGCEPCPHAADHSQGCTDLVGGVQPGTTWWCTSTASRTWPVVRRMITAIGAFA